MQCLPELRDGRIGIAIITCLRTGQLCHGIQAGVPWMTVARVHGLANHIYQMEFSMSIPYLPV